MNDNAAMVVFEEDGTVYAQLKNKKDDIPLCSHEWAACLVAYLIQQDTTEFWTLLTKAGEEILDSLRLRKSMTELNEDEKIVL